MATAHSCGPVELEDHAEELLYGEEDMLVRCTAEMLAVPLSGGPPLASALDQCEKQVC